jgi:hypothetical protein
MQDMKITRRWREQDENQTGSQCTVIISYFTFVYHATYSEGVRSGQLIKFSHKGVFKTWEGEISQGMSGSQIFLSL